MLATLMMGIGAGALLGAALGSLRTCKSGSCPLTASPRRGATWGGLMGFLFALTILPAGNARSAESDTGKPSAVAQVATTGEFTAKVLEHKGKALVDFYATWCGPCKVYKPTFDKVAGDLAAKARFVAVDVDKLPEVAAAHGVKAVPTTLLFEDGKVVKRFVGVQTENTLREALGAAPARTSEPKKPVWSGG